MKVYTKHELKVFGNPTGSAIWFMHDTETRQALCIKNYDSLLPTLPYSISGTCIENCLWDGNIIITENEFQEVYDKAINSLQNYIP